MEMSNPSSSNASLVDPPVNPPDSPGSSVSTRLQEEYDELLKYAVVVPDYNPKDIRGKLKVTNTSHEDDIITMTGMRPSPRSGFVHEMEAARRKEAEEEEGEQTPRGGADNSGRDVKQLPDFQQSPIYSQGRSSSFSDKLRADASEDFGGGHPFIQTLFREAGSTREGTADRDPVETVYTATIDRDVGKMETMLDQWCLELKRNVLAEFSQAKIVIEQKSRQELLRETTRHASEKAALTKELDSMKEFLHTYEQTMERKDAIISNLTSAVYRQRDKLELMRNFCNWRTQHNDAKRESFALQLARKHYERTLNRRVLSAWFSVVHSKWRQRVEKACQNKAQEICMQVTADYEAKIASLNEAQESTRVEVRRLHIQREKYEEAMKKAFMRGVCALNMEAMSMFHGDEGEDSEGRPADNRNSGDDVYSDNLDNQVLDKGGVSSKSIPHDAVRASVSTDPPPPRVVTSQGMRSAPVSTGPLQTSTKHPSVSTTSQKTRVSTKVTGKGGSSGRPVGRSLSPSLQPPMASVVVERHHPVNKQTIGHAIASKFPKTSENEKFRQLAGQGGMAKAPPIQSVRVVE